MFKFLTGSDDAQTDVKIDKSSVERLRVGSVLLENNAFLPKHRSPQWRVIKQFRDPNDTPHVVIQNLREPSNMKSLSLQGLVTTGKYQIRGSHTAKAAE
jgi:hypothetical protein